MRRLVGLVGCLLLVVLAGCTTVRPKIVEDAMASWDGGEQNSGVIALTSQHGAIITQHARDRYNSLINVYGDRFNPSLSKDAGITTLFTDPPTFQIDAEHLVKFMQMNRWRKSGL